MTEERKIIMPSKSDRNRNAAKKVLQEIEKQYPRYHSDNDMMIGCVLGLGNIVGTVLAWRLHHHGEESFEKALAVIMTRARQTAHDSASILREKKF